MAVKGKLVEQDPTEEPASELAKKIFSGNDSKNSKNDTRKDKGIIELTGEEELPSGWTIVKFGDVASYKKGPFGSSITKSMFVPKSTDTFKIYEQKNAIRKNAFLGDYYITKEKYETLKTNDVIPNDIIVSCAGTVGETFVLPPDSEPGIINQALMRVRLTDHVIPEYYLMYFESVLEEQIKGKSKGSAIKNIPPVKVLKNIDFLLPPFEEQRRIVHKVEMLKAEIDQLGRYLERKERLEIVLPQSVISAISNCQNEEELKVQLELVIEHFTEVFQTPESLQELRNVILQLAIQGKLVPQNPIDEPAGELLKHIQAEKELLVKAKKTKQEQALSEIEDDEIPFEIPESWQWVRLSEICEYIQRGKSPKYSPIEKYPVIAQKCVQWTGVSLENALFIEPSSIEKYTEERFLQHGDILWNSTGRGSCGRVGKFSDSIRNGFEKIVADSHVTVVRCFKQYVNFDYLFMWLKSPEVQSVIESKASGSTNQIELATSTIKEQLISLPPLNEQKRIVNKIESLLVVINQLEKEMLHKQRVVNAMAAV